MKKIIALALVLVIPTASLLAAKESKPAQTKSKSAQAKVYRHHEQNWAQPEYRHDRILFKCFDSWGSRLRGKFTQEQQYFIELGGGSCQRHSRRSEYSALRPIRAFDFPVSDVHRAIREIKSQYRLGRARLIETENIDAGFKTFKYTLVFKNGRHGYRAFRVKHNRRNGNIRTIYEV